LLLFLLKSAGTVHDVPTVSTMMTWCGLPAIAATDTSGTVPRMRTRLTMSLTVTGSHLSIAAYE
jgi:hypothetical protein